jgi:hypothetical protein
VAKTARMLCRVAAWDELSPCAVERSGRAQAWRARGALGAFLATMVRRRKGAMFEGKLIISPQRHGGVRGTRVLALCVNKAGA